MNELVNYTSLTNKHNKSYGKSVVFTTHFYLLCISVHIAVHIYNASCSLVGLTCLYETV